MQRSFVWGVFAILAILLAPFAGALGAPASIVRADVSSPAAVSPDDEIIVITATGQLRVDDFFTPAGYKPVSWNSGSETGFTVVAGGDFNGDGDAELVAARGSLIRVFDPVVQPGRAAVDFTVDLGSQRNVRLLNTGDFDADGRDEFALINYVPGGTIQAALQVYDGGTNATASEWTLRNVPVANYAEYGAMFQDMSVGDFNNDGADDLVMIRNVSDQRLVQAWNVRTWASIAAGSNYCCEWLAVAGGNISLGTPGDEIALLRDGYNAATNGLILFRVVSGAFADLVSDPAWRWYPDFRSLALGDLNGDGDDEVVQLRDPVEPRTSLLMVNPVGAAMNPFQQATGAGSVAFRIVRTGDVDGDLLDEIVILKGDRYRVYTEPNVDARATETSGAFYTPGGVSNLPFLALANVDGPGQPLGPVLNVSPTSLSFDLEYRQPSPMQNINITNQGTSDVLNWQAEVTTGSAWLRLSQTAGTTPGTLGVSIDTSAIVPGTYLGKIRISATSDVGTVQGSPQEVTVSVTIRGVTMVVSPRLLTFNVKYGYVSPVLPVSIASSGGSSPIEWRAEIVEGSQWLNLNPMQGISPSTMNVSVNTRAMPLGSYTGTIRVRALDSQIAAAIQFITVDLTVADGGVVVTPDQLTINHVIGTPATTAQVLIERPSFPTAWTATALPAELADVARAKLAAGEFQVTDAGIVFDGLEAPTLDWLTFTPGSGTTPTNMTVSVQGTTPGLNHAVIFVNSATGTREIRVTGWIANHFYTTYTPLVLR